MDDVVTAILLGVLEGLTEFVPVSSTGHLVLLGTALGFTGARAEAFEVFIQLGAILAVVVLYWRRFIAIAQIGREGDAFSGRQGAMKLMAACIPVVIVGGLAHHAVKSLMSPFPVALALIAGGIAILLFDRQGPNPRIATLEQLTIKDCLLVGTFQCLSLWPGVSRSGATIIGALLIGCSRTVAAEFSFLVAVPVMCAAVGFKMITELHALTADDLGLFAVGFFVAFVVALAAIRFLLAFVQRYSMAPFAWYRIALGILVLAMI